MEVVGDYEASGVEMKEHVGQSIENDGDDLQMLYVYWKWYHVFGEFGRKTVSGLGMEMVRDRENGMRNGK